MSGSPLDRFSWSGKRVLITGGHGFVGPHVVRRLVETRGVPNDDISVPRSRERDLRILDEARAAVEGHDVVLHLAADTGGLGYSAGHSAQQYYNCSLIDLQVIEAARLGATPRLVNVSSSTAYPEHAPSPLEEHMLFDGVPRETHLGYGMAKRNLVTLSSLYHGQYGMHIASIISSNAYGPGDEFDLKSSHVVPATILKCLRDPELIVWGDGSAIRDFFYVEDLAEAILLGAEGLPPGEAVNVGSGQPVSIKELVSTIARLTNFSGPVRYDTSKPAGEPRRIVSIDRARQLMGFIPSFDLEKGLSLTIAWYRRAELSRRAL